MPERVTRTEATLLNSRALYKLIVAMPFLAANGVQPTSSMWPYFRGSPTWPLPSSQTQNEASKKAIAIPGTERTHDKCFLLPICIWKRRIMWNFIFLSRLATTDRDLGELTLIRILTLCQLPPVFPGLCRLQNEWVCPAGLT